MKKTLSLILALALMLGCVLALASCKKTSEIYEIVASSSPTKTVTLVDCVTASGDVLHGNFIMEVEGNNSIFTYDYQRYRTIKDGVANNTDERIKTVEGTVFYKDGKFSFDGDEWEAEAPTSASIRFDLRAEYLTNASLNGEKELVAELTPENAINVLGVDIKASANARITVRTNGKNLSQVIIEYTNADGDSVTIDTTYTYNSVSLTFPDVGEPA